MKLPHNEKICPCNSDSSPWIGIYSLSVFSFLEFYQDVSIFEIAIHLLHATKYYVTTGYVIHLGPFVLQGEAIFVGASEITFHRDHLD